MKYTLLLPFSLLLSTLSFANEKQHVDLLIHHANVVDIKNAVVIPNQTIAITDAKIIARGDDALKLNYHATTQVDAQGRFVMPGLWDMHVHFGGGDALIEENKQLLPLYLAYGVTTVRDAAADLSPSVLSWREQITKGELIGPTIYTSGPKLEGKDSIWPGDLEVETTQEMHAAIDKLDAMNVDFVKITDSALTPELYLQAVKEVKKRGYKISGHIPFSLSVTDVSSAGLDAIEHMTYLLKAAAKNEDDISAKVKAGELSYRSALPVVMDNIDKDTAMKKYRLLAKNNTAIVPTLIGGQVTAYIDEDNHQQDEFLNYLGKGLKDTYQWRVDRANKDTPAQIKARKQRFVQTAQLLPWAQEAGVPIIAGTDAGFLNSYIYPGLSLHQELAIFSDYGLTPQQILHSATQAGPTFLDKAQQFGSLEVGKVADIIILDSNPLINVRNTQSLQGVISHNRYYDKAALENLKAQAKQFVSSQQ